MAANIVHEKADKGGWVVLQNVHLAPQFFPFLVKEFESIGASVAPDFRLWIISEPIDSFPVALLEHSVRLVHEPPYTVRSSFMELYKPLNNNFFELALYTEPLKKMAFLLAFFHISLLKRHHFGPLGWSRTVQFTASDLHSAFAFIYRSLETCPYMASYTGVGPLPTRAIRFT